MKINTYRDLKIWQKAMVLVTEVYSITNKLPDSEKFGLIAQMRRSSVSVPSNMAEGYGRNSTNDYLRFLQIAVGSLYELQTQIIIAYKLKYISQSDYQLLFEKSREIERMTTSLIRKL